MTPYTAAAINPAKPLKSPLTSVGTISKRQQAATAPSANPAKATDPGIPFFNIACLLLDFLRKSYGRCHTSVFREETGVGSETGVSPKRKHELTAVALPLQAYPTKA